MRPLITALSFFLFSLEFMWGTTAYGKPCVVSRLGGDQNIRCPSNCRGHDYLLRYSYSPLPPGALMLAVLNLSVTGTPCDDRIRIDLATAPTGVPATFTGSELVVMVPRALTGARGRITAFGQDGNDVIWFSPYDLPLHSITALLDGGAGHDTLRGSKKGDRLFGGSGDDVIWEFDSGPQGDEIFGGDGDDCLVAVRGNNEIIGGDGDDLVRGVGEILGGDGDDRIDATLGILEQRLFGGDGDDWIKGGRCSDAIFGGDGDDVLWGGIDDDASCGGSVENSLFGGDGNDVLVRSGPDDSVYSDDGESLFDALGKCLSISTEDGGCDSLNFEVRCDRSLPDY